MKQENPIQRALKNNIWLFIAAILIFPAAGAAQTVAAQVNDLFDDPCGYDPLKSMALLEAFGPGWGYNYDSLLVDLDTWRQSPYCHVDSAGASVQNRALWMLTITDPQPAETPRLRIWIHARTHPGEVQGWWVTDEIIKILLSDSPLAQLLRRKCIFNIMPMYNPDGVELGYLRENANGVDIESNWDVSPGEPEVNVLRSLFAGFMGAESPIRVALNMHSAFACKRFFVYHDAIGTSQAYAEDETNFVTSIHDYWPEGIEPWHYRVTWKNGTPRVYPESWFWFNHREAVMALTYEDMNCETAGDYDLTANAMLNGIADYLEIREVTAITRASAAGESPHSFLLSGVYPNPLHPGTPGTVQVRLSRGSDAVIKIYDLLGRLRGKADFSALAARTINILHFDTSNLATGSYFLRVESAMAMQTQRFSIVR